MNTKSKSKLLSSSAYIIFTVMALAVLFITLYAVITFVSRRNETTPPIDSTPVSDSGNAHIPSSDSPSTVKPPRDSEHETVIPDTGTSPDTSSPENPADADPLAFSMPAEGSIIKEYSSDLPVFSLTMNDYRTHMGIDIGGALGDEVYACADGTVTDIYDDAFMGKCITIDHGNGLSSHYMNLSEELPSTIREGCTVTGGQLIGAIGETALIEIAESPHLHFAMTSNAVSVDPTDYLPSVPAVAEQEDYSESY